MKSYVLATDSDLEVNRISMPTPTISTSFAQLGTNAYAAIIVGVLTASVVIVFAALLISRRKRNLRKTESNVSEVNTLPKDGDGKPSTE